MSQKGVKGAVVVAALGYFVDVYDLLIFSIVRISSLKDLAVPEPEILSTGVMLLNCQMAGMLIGGVFWGILGDKRGRLSVLLGSIFMYSVANIANGLVTSIEAYALWRFLAGVGLAGELGAGITLVSELMTKEKRGVGTTIVASVGVMGAVFAAIIGEYLTWKQAYFVGGALGLALLGLRIAVQESGMFDSLKKKHHVKRGDLLQLVFSKERFFRYMNCILVGLPIWFSIGILVTFSPEFGKAYGIQDPVSAGSSVMFTYIGLVLGDLSSGLFSQVVKSRRKILGIFIWLTLICIVLYLFGGWSKPSHLYWMCLPLGFAVGYWAVFVTNAAEQFGTNLRATVTTTVPNFVRGAVVPITWAFEAFKHQFGLIYGALAVGLICIALALWALGHLKESFGSNLDFVEEL
ncbi:MAG: MFS transporter [Oligoflexia bacterium]|nr:MFS transporter [Oligoflexia bacterium]